MKRIVIINGQGGVGKDTFIELLTDTKLKIINVCQKLLTLINNEDL